MFNFSQALHWDLSLNLHGFSLHFSQLRSCTFLLFSSFIDLFFIFSSCFLIFLSILACSILLFLLFFKLSLDSNCILSPVTSNSPSSSSPISTSSSLFRSSSSSSLFRSSSSSRCICSSLSIASSSRCICSASSIAFLRFLSFSFISSKESFFNLFTLSPSSASSKYFSASSKYSSALSNAFFASFCINLAFTSACFSNSLAVSSKSSCNSSAAFSISLNCSFPSFCNFDQKVSSSVLKLKCLCIILKNASNSL